MTTHNFEVFLGRKGDRRRRLNDRPAVTFGRGGVIVFSPAAADALGDHVELLYTPEALGFRATYESNPNAYRARVYGNQRAVTAAAFSRFTGHDRTASVTYPAVIENDVVIVARTS